MSQVSHKVLYLSKGGNISGAQRQLLYLLKGLDRGRFTPVVLCTEGGQFVKELRGLGVRCVVRRLVGWRKSMRVFSRRLDVAYVSRLARRERVSLVHSSNFRLSEYMLRSAQKVNVPSILHVRAPIDQETAEKYRCSSATVLVAISKRVEMRLREISLVPQSRIVLIHDAVDQNLFVPTNRRPGENALRRKYGTNGNVLVGIVGRVEPCKEQLAFAEIAKEVLARTRNVTFLVIGKVRDLDYHTEMMTYMRDHDLLDHIHFAGRREDMPQVLAGLDVLVSLSGGSVRYEAMMCGTPVVCAWSRRAEESYHIRHNKTGFLVPERETAPVADVLVELIENADLRRRIGNDARKWAQGNLNHLQLASDTQSLYESLLQG
jgi:glycosyltransferase involved in cell wall biosynthesis